MDARFLEGVVVTAMPERIDRIKHKAYVYLTVGRDLLVFRQPDQPYVGLQVPGGTVDPGESHLQAALREFSEETGLGLPHALEPIAEQTVLFDNDQGRDVHLRRLYHARAPQKPHHSWEHFEMSPSAGGDPIRFELFWLDIAEAAASLPTRFFTGFHAPLPTLWDRLGAGA
ncbi:NUDIX hydrolase [Stappia indica]|uniref:NUDIX hydrolase n=1 Tax=Stappia indica TaxID=538381 RepID=UPI001CD55574|nr:NUDIX domain-containing protein [Stappia indica]MCA1299765.1 NUDIX domain-containing protein [Stappia indica]